jgi:hypothetical protein
MKTFQVVVKFYIEIEAETEKEAEKIAESLHIGRGDYLELDSEVEVVE